MNVKIIGRLDCDNFQRQVAAGKWALSSKYLENFKVEALFEMEWTQWVNENRRDQSQLWFVGSACSVFIDDLLLERGDLVDFCEEKFGYEENDDLNFEDIAKNELEKRMKLNNNDFCFLRFGDEEGEIEGKLVIELFKSIAPKTCKNFKDLCQGENQRDDGSPLSYSNSLIHRIVQNGWIQGGDIDQGSKGDGGYSATGTKTFEDESFAVSHRSRGIVGMANCGAHTNQSQFYITLEAKPYLDKKFVAFGQCVHGSEILNRIQAIQTFNERPIRPLKIIQSGLLTQPTF